MSHNAKLQDAIFDAARDDHSPMPMLQFMPKFMLNDLVARLKPVFEPWHYHMSAASQEIAVMMERMKRIFDNLKIDHSTEGRVLLARHRRRRHK